VTASELIDRDDLEEAGHGQAQDSGTQEHPQGGEGGAQEAHHRASAEEDAARTEQAGREGGEAQEAQELLRGPGCALLLLLGLVAPSGVRAGEAWIHIRGGWVPDDAVVAEMKAKLRPYLEERLDAQRRRLRAWSEYTFQYQGRHEKGRWYVLVNAFCEPQPGWDVAREIVLVPDGGGTCYFNLKFDHPHHYYYDLSLNGEYRGASWESLR